MFFNFYVYLNFFGFYCNIVKYFVYGFLGFLVGGGDGEDFDGEGKLVMFDILVFFIKE